MKRILFINPYVQVWSKRKMRPVGLAYIMTAVKKSSIEFDFMDMYAYNLSVDQLKDRLRRESYDIFAIGCIVTGLRLVSEISSIIRESNPEATIIAGNSVASSIPELLLRNTEVDIAVMGEADITIVQLLRALMEGQSLSKIKGIAYLERQIFHKNPAQELICDINKIAFPEWNLFDTKYYNEGFLHFQEEDLRSLVVYPLTTSRGCPHRCTFCYNVFIGHRYRRYSEDVVISEFKRLHYKYHASYIQFSDELTFPNRSSVGRLVRRIERLPFNINWGAITRSDLFSKKDVPLIRRMRAAGCASICFALEHANQEILEAMGKKYRVKQAVEHISALREGGVTAGASVIFGYPQETPETITETFSLCERLNLVPGVGFLQPLPGTPIYSLAVQRGFIKNELEYLMHAGDREILHVNLTKIPTDEFTDMVVSGITALAKKMGVEKYCQFLRAFEEYNWQDAPIICHSE